MSSSLNSESTTPSGDSQSSDLPSGDSLSQSVDTAEATARVVAKIAEENATRAEFLRSLAQHFQSEFGVGLVAISAADWEQPIMLVADETLGRQIHRLSVRSSLAIASPTPTATDVALRDPSSTSVDDQAPPSDSLSVRAFQVELHRFPDPIAVLLVHRLRYRPEPSEQLAAIHKLGLYAKPVGESLDRYRGNPVHQQILAAESESMLCDRNAMLQLHRNLNVGATAYRIANESRRLIRCDRVTVLIPKARKWKVRAVSGVAVVDRRSNAVRSIERFVDRAIVMSRPLVLPGEEMLPPQIQRPLDEYLDESGVASVVLLPIRVEQDEASDEARSHANDPLKREGRLVGVILVESFSEAGNKGLSPVMSTIASESSVALANSLEYEGIWGVSFWRVLGKIKQSSKSFRLALALFVVAIAFFASTWIQLDHYIVATGTVQPQSRRQVFALVDGVVNMLHVADGESVQSGDLLLELENTELDNRVESLAGQIQTTLQRLASIKAVRLSDDKQESQSSRLAVEQQQYESELANLQSQQEVLEAERRNLLVKSPIDGSIVGWQLHQRLASRPVSRGNLLLSVVNENGPWELNLQVDDSQSNAMLESLSLQRNLPVTFAVATQPQRSYAATLIHVASAARVDDTKHSVIDAVAAVVMNGEASQDADMFTANDVRIGADVTARVYCGRRSLLRSWFSDVFDFVNRKVLFYFR
ncbi:HlyD family secretion protein [Planctomycetes bacterium CA13]|uniref:HlyD family secretion protein n=1 Tax=Novipirellula herctigrandis TaxID=2527986 RepID=A0A5C5Z9B8_9BACT|nr:HlyD family secretion protein [Planctomycetes bacterium CA13]